MRIMAAGMHHPFIGRLKIVINLLVNRQGIHIGPNADCWAGAGSNHSGHTGPADLRFDIVNTDFS